MPMFDGYEDYYIDHEREQIDFGKDQPSDMSGGIHHIHKHFEKYYPSDPVDSHCFIGYSKGKYSVNKTEANDSEDYD